MASQHLFKDEWLIKLVGSHPQVTPELIASWREEKRPYLAQVLVDNGLLGIPDLSELIRGAFRIESFDSETLSLDAFSSELIPKALCQRLDVFPVRPSDHSIEVAMSNPVDAIRYE